MICFGSEQLVCSRGGLSARSAGLDDAALEQLARLLRRGDVVALQDLDPDRARHPGTATVLDVHRTERPIDCDLAI